MQATQVVKLRFPLNQSFGDVLVEFAPGKDVVIMHGHSDNEGLDDESKLWLVEAESTSGTLYRFWMRAFKLVAW